MLARILVAEDDDALRASLCDFLRSRRHEVLEASDGAQAFAVAEKDMPHLIITDVVMHGVYGTTAAKRLHDYWRTAKIPIILISGTIGSASVTELLKDPTVRFLKKPVNLALLERTIADLLPQGGFTP
ncbi:MAG: histidine kinase [Elusimicrobia bacterium]|nr:MAG: histidine kinase [Elusimicrobiota bacterium]